MRQAQVRTAAIIGGLLWLASIGTSGAEQGFDEKYQRDFNIFNPINQYRSGNPLNPISTYDPANPFNPINQFDLGNPANPINQFNPNNPFNPAIAIAPRIRSTRLMSSIPTRRLRSWGEGAGWGTGHDSNEMRLPGCASRRIRTCQLYETRFR
jgi:hypothetical protein